MSQSPLDWFPVVCICCWTSFVLYDFHVWIDLRWLTFCCIKKWEKLSINLFYKRTITRQVKITEQKRWNENVWKKTTHPSAWLFLFCHRIDVKSSVNSIYLMFLRMWFGTLLSSVVECATLANCKRKKHRLERFVFGKKIKEFYRMIFFLFCFLVTESK